MDQDFQDEFVQDERASLSKLQETILFGAARYWIWIVGATILGAGIGLYLGASKPNTYLSSAKLRLAIGEREKTSEETLLGISSTRESSPTMEDEIHMLTDRAVFRTAVESITPELYLQPADPTRYDDETTPLPVQWMHKLQKYLIQTQQSGGDLEEFSDEDMVELATEIMIRDTVIFPNTGSNVITVLHHSTSPEKARFVTETLVQAFLDRHREQFSLERLLPKQEDAVVDARGVFLEAKRKLDDYASEKGFADLELEIGNGFDNLGEITQQLFQAKADLGSKRAQYDRLAEEIEGNESGLEPEQEQELLADKLTLAGEVAGLVEQVAGLERASLEQEARLDDLTSYKPNLRTLTDELETARANYEQKREILDKYSSLANLEDSNLKLIGLPTTPLEKEGPKRMKLMILGVAAGFALGGLIAVLRQAFDKSLRYPSTVQRWSGVQLLAVIPESPDVRRLQRVRHFI